MLAVRLTHPLIAIGESASYLASIKLGKRGRDESTDELPKDVQNYAAFAETAYRRSKKQRVAALREHYTGEDIKDWVFDHRLSNRHVSVFVHEGRGEVVTSFRGTQLDDRQDLEADVLLALGHEKHAQRLKSAKERMARILHKYPDKQHILTGHSLGGSINTYLFHQFPDQIKEVHNFNPGASVNQLLANLRSQIPGLGRDNEKNIHNHIVVGDPISALARGHATTHVYEMKKGSLNPHSLQQFL
jgi:hypothetical protein